MLQVRCKLTPFRRPGSPLPAPGPGLHKTVSGGPEHWSAGAGMQVQFQVQPLSFLFFSDGGCDLGPRFCSPQPPPPHPLGCSSVTLSRHVLLFWAGGCFGFNSIFSILTLCGCRLASYLSRPLSAPRRDLLAPPSGYPQAVGAGCGSPGHPSAELLCRRKV